jgi:magnesium chelatase subunit I
MKNQSRSIRIKPIDGGTAGGIAAAVYPFSAIVGQEEMKLALELAVIDPNIGGVMIFGHRGTGKSTAVRSLADLLPRVARVRGCVYGCDPAGVTELCDNCSARRNASGRLPSAREAVQVVDLPLGATEDRVCGTLDIERALAEGIKEFEPGLLARANRGFLYIDEINLLDDHLVDILLDSAASGRNIVEREGVSVNHPARFVLVGSGNPEEGELRPQLLDRFGLYAEIKTITDVDERVRIVERREQFESDPAAFELEWSAEQDRLRKRLVRARRIMPSVRIEKPSLLAAARLCASLNVDGHRGELTIARAAKALAAFSGRRSVTDQDIRVVAVMALRHRLRRDPLGNIGSADLIEQGLNEVLPRAPSRLTAVK